MEMGGTERLVLNLARKLNRDVFNPSVAWFSGKESLKEFEDLNIPLYYVPKIKRVDFSAMRKVGDIIKQCGIHIVNAHHFMPMVYSFYGCKIRNHADLVYTEHSEWEVETIPLKWRIVGSYLLKHADAVIGVNPGVTAELRNKFRLNNSKSLSIPNGVDLETFKNGNKKQTLRKELGVGENEIVIGTVANFRRIKNHTFLLQALSELIRDHGNVKLLLIGQGFVNDIDNSEQEIRNFIDKHKLGKNVLLLGYRSDIPELLNTMDIYCLTSFREGLPISLIEAMASGLPVVGTDVEGIRDIIKPRENGFLVKLNDVEGMKNALCTLLENKTLRIEFGQMSRFLAVNTYSMEHCARKYQDLFISIFRKNRKIESIRKPAACL